MTEVDIRELRTCDWDRTHTQNDLVRCMVFPELTGVREGCLDARLTEGTPHVEPEGGSGLRCGRRKRQNEGGDTGRPPGSPRATDPVVVHQGTPLARRRHGRKHTTHASAVR